MFVVSGVFLPGLVSPEMCKGKDGTLNKPLCIAWSSSGRNHYIPLVAIKGIYGITAPLTLIIHQSKQEKKQFFLRVQILKLVLGFNNCPLIM